MSEQPVTNNLAEQVRQKRKARGWSQEMLAGFSGVSWMTIFAWEHGQRSPRLDNALAILDALDLELVIKPRG